jgi:uncharacterized protein YjbJ (UPF0337 family)
MPIHDQDPNRTGSRACVLPKGHWRKFAVSGEASMNKDQVKGGVKESTGKLQRKLGEAVDSPETEVKGATREVAGKAQKRAGDTKETLKQPPRKP